MTNTAKSVVLEYEEMVTFDSSTLTGSYQALGSPLAHPGLIIKMFNTSDEDVTISIDGTNDHDVCPAGSFFLYDCAANKQAGPTMAAPVGRQYYINGSAGTGNIYFVVQYAKES